MNQLRWLQQIVTLMALMVLFAGCAQLPEYARPQFYRSEKDSTASKTGFGYRQLAISDFQATSLADSSEASHKHIYARSCLTIRPAQKTRISIFQTAYQDQSLFVGKISGAEFEALFIPECSWWNPDVPTQRTAYVLEHEQIHFALAELAARLLNRLADDELGDFVALGNDYQEAQQEIVEKLQGMAYQAMESGLEEHTDFDESTSLFHDPEAQRSWRETMEKRLQEERSR
ncbi:MAG: hypothetical protein HKP41_04535 [Desulfobacterales bacterium]|nr:hypothetical protein [Desulfobacterales bacterium]